ncbi:MAG: IS66 family transposase, partial [Verrucomicrobiota bacterium]
MSAKERQKLRSKGIFTVTQLSYTFRPPRRPKRQRDKREKYHHSLKALAIREKKIHIVGSPELKIEGTPVYLDVEGLPDRDFYYLIGLRIGNGESAVQHSLWADTVEDEGKIWWKFLGILETVEKPVLIHYGSYETTFVRRMSEQHGGSQEGSASAKAIVSAINLVAAIFGRIYFPTCANGLKDIAGWFGFRWSGNSPSGTQTICWRHAWENSADLKSKEKLITYNSEDCQALQEIAGLVSQIYSGKDSLDIPSEVVPADAAPEFGGIWHRFSSPISAFEAINKAAKWDYQRNRVYVRTDKGVRVVAAKRQSHPVRSGRVNEEIVCQNLSTCPRCNRSADLAYAGPRVLYNLRFSSHGIRRWIVRYHVRVFHCPYCHFSFGKPKEFWGRTKYGYGAVAVLVYSVIHLCMVQTAIQESLNSFFNLDISLAEVNRLKASASGFYEETRKRILARLVAGPLIHADETRIVLKNTTAYVWVFTSFREVVFFYAETREGNLLREALARFNGVLVSDFYAAYDAMPCPQQKCLIHLMRDLNDLLLDHPYDQEAKKVATGFGDLLKAIVETIDRRGLKRYFLRKHQRQVQQFYRKLRNTAWHSEAALRCKERFEKNRDKLFTFLDYDAVPWNNNNAEHAIKAFAKLRRAIVGLSTPKGIEEYLILLSLCQTCKYMGVDFLDFLRSGEKDIHAFAESRRGRRPRPQGSPPTGLRVEAIPDAGDQP